ETRERFAGDGQELPVPPEVLGTPLDLLACDADGRVVVDGLERPKAFVADVGRLGRERRFTDVALESDQGGQRYPHLSFAQAKAGIGTLPRPLGPPGCRGVVGPVPQPLWIRRPYSVVEHYSRLVHP